MKERLLTKSLFVRALKCPRKLFYAGKPAEYADNSLGDEFLEALAKGGIQVGTLARCYFPDGILVDVPDNQTALAQTAELLQRDRVVLFEAAIRHGATFIRADILEKNGPTLDLIEVKAKSYDSDSSAGFLLKNGNVDKGWLPYLYDVAFQRHVLQQAFPAMTVKASLMLADKRKKASVDGLNQRFVLQEVDGRFRVDLQGDCSKAALGEEILVRIVQSQTTLRSCGRFQYLELRTEWTMGIGTTEVTQYFTRAKATIRIPTGQAHRRPTQAPKFPVLCHLNQRKSINEID
jgi:hypothetical protein